MNNYTKINEILYFSDVHPVECRFILSYISELEHNWNELKKCIKDEIEKTENLIKEDCNMIQINNIRKMLNEDRECWLYKISELEEGGNKDLLPKSNI